jgi:hypothetical protein
MVEYVAATQNLGMCPWTHLSRYLDMESRDAFRSSDLQWLLFHGDLIELDHELDHFQSTGYTPILHPVFKTIIFTSYLAISWKQSLCPCPP